MLSSKRRGGEGGGGNGTGRHRFLLGTMAFKMEITRFFRGRKSSSAGAMTSGAAKNTTLTRKQISKYKKSFRNFDKDGSGTITADELKDVMKSLGVPTSDEEVQSKIIHWNAYQPLLLYC